MITHDCVPPIMDKFFDFKHGQSWKCAMCGSVWICHSDINDTEGWFVWNRVKSEQSS